MFTKLRRRFASLYLPPSDEESLKSNYAAMPYVQLKELDPKQLGPLARRIRSEELDRRERELRSRAS